MISRSNVQQNINANWKDKHIQIYLLNILLNLYVKSVMRKENVKMVLMSANNVNILHMKNAD